MHDAAGNRLALTVRAVNETPEGWFREGWHNDTRYVFDRAGNLRQRRYTDGSRQDFVWDESQQLVAVHQGESVTHYAYDGLGRRIGKQTATESRWFYWQGDALLAEVAEPGGEPLRPLALYDVAGRLQREKRQAALFNNLREYVYYPGSFRPFALLTQQDGVRSSYHYHCDPNGAPVRLTDVQGGLVWSEQCGVWGEPGVVHADRVANPLRFQGQYFDAETGLHYNRYRYYDPQTGSYISQDPIGLVGGMNPYGYVHNPNSFIDPLGLAGCSAGKVTGDIKTLREKIRLARNGDVSAQAEIAYAKYMRSKGNHVHFNTPPNRSVSMADFTINGVQVDTKLLSGIGGNAAKNVTKGVKQVGDNGIVQVIRSSDSKNTLGQFEEFFGGFKPNNPSVTVDVIDQSVLAPFWKF
ncbi:Cell wall-associated polypeptide CWBP200 [Serratia rubidaea]|nr:Cell wall-associated polypeptide CWBP200 [Serratia rubidaea]